MALLNDEGIVAGCEGDIPALWTMLYAKYAYGEAAFMANPASSNRKECTIDFAHCTIPLSMVHGYRLPSHFESQSGIGIAGSVPSGRYRIVKISGKNLDQFYETEGDLIMNTNIPQRCRTQIRFRFASETEFERFMRVSKGNHIILCKASGQGGPLR
jgi:L-fucose isomerase-like protein